MDWMFVSLVTLWGVAFVVGMVMIARCPLVEIDTEKREYNLERLNDIRSSFSRAIQMTIHHSEMRIGWDDLDSLVFRLTVSDGIYNLRRSVLFEKLINKVKLTNISSRYYSGFMTALDQLLTDVTNKEGYLYGANQNEYCISLQLAIDELNKIEKRILKM